MTEGDVRGEREYLSQVLGVINAKLAETAAALERGARDYKSAAAEMWNDTSHQVRDFDDVISLSASNSRIRETADSVFQLELERSILTAMLDSPYFGRIDFKEDGAAAEKLYIGRHTLFDSHTYEDFVVDWRAPVASMYYDNDVGSASYESPHGTIKGEITLKRQYKISGGELQYLFDTDVTIRDELLGRVLSEISDGHLKVIISSIQREQNAAIRFPPARTLLISGPAGSGKTSVGLHRLAYLLYHNRGKLTSESFTIVSSNASMNSYISNILPDLGERDVNRAVISDIMRPLIPPAFDYTSPAELAEALLGGNPLRKTGVRIKASKGFYEAIRRKLENVRIKFPALSANGVEFCSSESFARECGGTLSQKRPYSRFDEFIDREYREWYAQNSEALEKQIYNESPDILLDSETSVMARARLRSYVAETKRRLTEENGLDERLIYKETLKDYAPNEKELLADTEKRLANGNLYFEDAVCLVNIAFLMGKITPVSYTRHVLIDEAQDMSYPQHMFLRGLYPNAVFTYLADTAQAVIPECSLMTDGELLDCMPDGFERVSLNRSYRCTGPINALACAIQKTDAQYHDRDGEKPLYVETSDVCGTIDSMIPTLSGTVGILVPAAREALRLSRKLKTEHSAVCKSEDSLTANVTVMPAYLAKGLEFDNVIIAGMPDSKRLLYLMCTRALTKLIFTGKFSERLEEYDGRIEKRVLPAPR